MTQTVKTDVIVRLSLKELGTVVRIAPPTLKGLLQETDMVPPPGSGRRYDVPWMTLRQLWALSQTAHTWGRLSRPMARFFMAQDGPWHLNGGIRIIADWDVVDHVLSQRLTYCKRQRIDSASDDGGESHV